MAYKTLASAKPVARSFTLQRKREEFMTKMVERARGVRDRVTQDNARIVLEGVYYAPHNPQDDPFGYLLTTPEIDEIIRRAWSDEPPTDATQPDVESIPVSDIR